MAEIHVEPKKHSSSIWLWVLLALVVLAVVYFLTRNNNKIERATDGMNTTSFLYVPGPAAPSFNAWQRA